MLPITGKKYSPKLVGFEFGICVKILVEITLYSLQASSIALTRLFLV